jgi:hypothetical protein
LILPKGYKTQSLCKSRIVFFFILLALSVVIFLYFPLFFFTLTPGFSLSQTDMGENCQLDEDGRYKGLTWEDMLIGTWFSLDSKAN